MDKYLLQLLNDLKTVIIPELGALTIVNPDTNECMFMPYLKHNDGTLAEFISQKEGIDLNDAKNLVAKYVREILVTLDKGDSYDIFQFGSFKKESSGDIEFIPWDAAIESAPAEKKDPVKEEIIEEEIKDAVIQKTEAEEPNIASEDLQKGQDNLERENTEEAKTFQEAIEAVTPFHIEKEEPTNKEVPIKTESQETIPKELNVLEREELEATQAKLEALKKRKLEKPRKKRKGVGFYVLLILIILVVSFSGYIVYDYNNSSTPIFGNSSEKLSSSEEKIEKANKVVNEPKIEEAVNEELPVAAPIEPTVINEQPAKIEQTRNGGSGKYHIMAGAFSTQSNAEKLIQKLKADGISGSVVQEKGLFKVSLGNYSTKEAASGALAAMNYSGNTRIHLID